MPMGKTAAVRYEGYAHLTSFQVKRHFSSYFVQFARVLGIYFFFLSSSSVFVCLCVCACIFTLVAHSPLYISINIFCFLSLVVVFVVVVVAIAISVAIVIHISIDNEMHIACTCSMPVWLRKKLPAKPYFIATTAYDACRENISIKHTCMRAWHKFATIQIWAVAFSVYR